MTDEGQSLNLISIGQNIRLDALLRPSPQSMGRIVFICSSFSSNSNVLCTRWHQKLYFAYKITKK